MSSATPSSTAKAPASSSGTGGTGTSGGHVAHHIAEFGQVDDIVHITHKDEHEKEEIPPPPRNRKDRLAKKERVHRLYDRLFAERHLMQYFHNDVLYRSEGSRSIGPDELFLDLVIVGGIAALGHELRETFEGWRDIEKFILLFSAIYNGWRNLIMLWNLWDVKSDFIDKAAIYLVFFSLTGIALGAHGAFDDGIRPYVAICAFAATVIPAVMTVLWGVREPLLKNEINRINQILLMGATNIIGVLPYFAAAFVGTDRATRILFWFPPVLQSASFFITGTLYRFIHRNREGYSRLAVAIELMVEKYEVLTMIVLGESVLGMLFEAALVITSEGARVSSLYAAAAAGTAMLYCFQTLYTNVDNNIVKGGVHALRYKGLFGMIWGQLHTLYHLALILFATGLGIAMKDITIPPGSKTESAEKVLDLLVRAGDEASDGSAKFARNERWLFSVGWGASLILSGIFGALHDGGPRAATKRWRLAVRFPIAVGVMIGLPFADISAGSFLLVYTIVQLVITVVEYVFQHMDRMGFYKSEFTITSSSGDGFGSSDSFGDELEDDEEPRSAEDALSKENQEASENAIIERALQQRLRRRHCSRLVICQEYQKEKEKAAKEAEAQEDGEEKSKTEV